MTILIVARKSDKEDWGVLQVFDETFIEDPFRAASLWRSHMPGEEIRVAKIPSKDGSKCSPVIDLKNLKIVTRAVIASEARE